MKVDTNTCEGGLPSEELKKAQDALAITELPILSTVQQFALKHPFLTESALRAYIYAAKSRLGANGRLPPNGMEAALVRRGRRVFIHEQRFFQWFTKK